MKSFPCAIGTTIARCFLSLSTLVAALGTPEVSSAMNTTDAQFRFETFVSLSDMRAFLVRKFPVGSSRLKMRQLLVEQGRGTLLLHPSQRNVEKYIYDINLCNYYVWRWNISGDFDASGHLVQAYVNGESLFDSSSAEHRGEVLAKSGKASIFRMTRPRPEAYKGEDKLTFLLLDADSNLRTTDDQVLTGTGPSRADPFDMGSAHHYVNVEPWRSIFDFDRAAHIADYEGNCSEVDKLRARAKGQVPPP